MEIERKYLIEDLTALPFRPEDYPSREIEQGYLCTDPVVRVRRDGSRYFLTYKSKGLMAREEYNLPLTRDSYLHLREKTDGRLITKLRYVIPLDGGLQNCREYRVLREHDGGIEEIPAAIVAHQSLGTYPAGTVRFAFGHCNTEEEVLYAARAVREICGR